MWVLEELHRDGDRLTSARKRLEREIDDEESQYNSPSFHDFIHGGINIKYHM